ncbi:MAG: hypothetical protein FWF70_02490 [Bacteroidetes bacterium]|nr:hypothetical protein [Bacteroidota bacterium]MCL1968749.1 hypothetical protein [Bacteroidota bacterium]
MAYESVDKLQKVLADEVFNHTKDPKKASGRALGTLVEIITYYLLKTWRLNNSISIERGLAEYGNPNITHNVEYSLHPIVRSSFLTIDKSVKSITSNVILKALTETGFDIAGFERKNNQLLSNNILRNACTIATSENSFLLSSIKSDIGDKLELHIYEQNKKPYAIFECKRVGVEEGMTKGPQTIEKAKQGAYVARTASSLQKIRSESGEMQGIIYKSNGSYIIKPYTNLMDEIIFSSDKELLRKFILTVGVVSNHGNWIKKTLNGVLNFSEENFQKELMVLAQSYDWLLFLTDNGLSDFIDKLLLHPISELRFLRDTFLSSYAEDKKKNQFTKVQMNIEADRILLKYFSENLSTVESWFNVVSPTQKKLTDLKRELDELKNKNWQEILL